jgi:hypothetical protein
MINIIRSKLNTFGRKQGKAELENNLGYLDNQRTLEI